jgi:hypothetical protein
MRACSAPPIHPHSSIPSLGTTLNITLTLNLTQVKVGSPGEALDVLRRGARVRQKAATALNYASSRSHSVFSVLLCRPALAGAPAAPAAATAPPTAASAAASEASARTGANAEPPAP